MSQFILFDHLYEVQRMIAYSSSELINILADCDRWKSDGTWDPSTELFEQLYIIGGLKNSEFYQCVFVFIQSKREIDYDLMFKLLIANASEKYNKQLRPTVFMSDFEMAVINSVQTSFSGATHYGCQFHLCECLQRNIQANSLTAKIVSVFFPFFLIEDLTKSN